MSDACVIECGGDYNNSKFCLVSHCHIPLLWAVTGAKEWVGLRPPKPVASLSLTIYTENSA